MRSAIVALLVGTALIFPTIASAQSTASPFTSATRYDRQHRLTGTIAPDPDGSGPLHYLAVRNSYDDAGRLVKVEKGELAAWQSEAVAPADWSSFTTFTIQQTVDTVYDGLDRKIQESVSSGGTVYQATQYSYDPVGRLQCTAVRMNPALFTGLPTVRFPGLPDACALGTEGTQGPDRITKNQYDDTGQLQQVRKAVGTTIEQAYVSYTYTDNGKQEYITDANGNKARYIYDGHDRLYQWNFPDKLAVGTTSATDYEAYQYDANSNRIYLRKRDGTVFTYTYDALDRMKSKIAPSGTRSVYYDYDAWGRQTAARFDNAGGADAVGSGYDGFGRLVASTTRIGGVSRRLTYEYDADGNRTRVTHPDGVYFAYGYDGLDRMNHADWWAPGVGTVPFMAVAYDTAGRRALMNRASSYTSYGYDNVSRLTNQSQLFAGNVGNLSATFSYNPASQIASRDRSNNDFIAAYTNVNHSYAVNGLNQYSAVSGTTYGYDPNGNLTSDGTYTYAYDAENRLVATSAGAGLTYDPLGRLYQTSKASTGTTQFLYDGDDLVAEYNGSGTLLRRYMHGPGEDEPILWDEGSAMNCSGTRFLHTDHQGSVIATADCYGNRSTTYSYDEYGMPGSLNYMSRFQYTGQAWIPELGMYYYKARIYSPRLGRFMQTDPIGYKDQQNLYAYVANDPVNGRDPTGTEECHSNGDGTQTCTSNGSILDNAALALRAGYELVAYYTGLPSLTPTTTDSAADQTVSEARKNDGSSSGPDRAVPGTGRRAGDVRPARVTPGRSGPPALGPKIKKSDGPQAAVRGGHYGGVQGSRTQGNRFGKGKGGNGREDADGHQGGPGHNHAPQTEGAVKKGHWWWPW